MPAGVIASLTCIRSTVVAALRCRRNDYCYWLKVTELGGRLLNHALVSTNHVHRQIGLKRLNDHIKTPTFRFAFITHTPTFCHCDPEL